AMRAIAQMISYEVPLILSAVTVIMIAGSLSTVKIVEAQAGYAGGLPRWFVLTPWGLAGFILFMIAAAAESNRSPFDLPEGESEIIAGYYIEYSGFKFALFFLGEYIGMFAVSGLAITLFLGGWHAPFAFLTWIPSYFWFFGKLLTLAGAIAAMSLRNLVHCALALTVAFAGLAALYLQLDAQFVGFAQILVYIGAVAILIVFAILLTRGSETPQPSILSPSWLGGITVAAVVFGVLAMTIVRS